VPSIPGNVGKATPEWRTILDFDAARIIGMVECKADGGDAKQNSKMFNATTT